MDAESPDIQIPGYQILRLIGSGANATVYLALQESLNRHVALKILQKFDRPAQAVRFFNEGQIVASMNHPNIITIYDIGSVGSQQYIAMEYLEQGSLRDVIDKGVSAGAALDIVQSIGSALEFVHQMDIVHRDIKPENILFHKNGMPKITDFGVAKVLDRDMNLTMDGTALGSPYYLSPEQAEGKELDGRSDIYALGVILFELLAHRKPFLGESQIEVIFAHLNKPIPSLPDKHLHYQSLVEKMMAKDADDRFSSAQEMLDYMNALRDLGAGKTGRRSSDMKRVKRAVRAEGGDGFFSGIRNHPVISAGTSLALLAAIAAVLLNDPSSKNTDSANAVASTVSNSNAEPVAASSIIPPDTSTTTAPLPVESQNTAQTPAIAESSDASVPNTDTASIAVDFSDENALGKVEVADEPSIDIEYPDTTKPSISEALAALNENNTESIDSLMTKAEEALKKYRLTSPKTDNAYYYYNKILKLDPKNKDARKGLRKLAGKYGSLADKALKKNDEEKARTYLERGLRIRPNDEALLQKVAHLDELQAARLAPPPPPPPPPPKPKPKPVNTSLQLLESLE